MDIIKNKIKQIAKQAKEASYNLSTTSTTCKNKVLKSLATALIKNKSQIKKANDKDIKLAKKKGLSSAMIDRLILNDKRINEMRQSVLDIAKLPDPIGEITKQKKRNGLDIQKVRIPLGVICIIYESRPNVTIDAISLCFKSGNAVILRGGSEAFYSNTILLKIASAVFKKNKINPNVALLIPFTKRSAMIDLLQLDQYINVVIPRGGKELMKFIGKHTKIPVIKHDKGVCSIFVDESASLKHAIKIINNAKTQRPGVCNAVETIYIHKKIADKILPDLFNNLTKSQVEIRGDKISKKILPQIKSAKTSDYETEYLDLILAVKIVTNVRDAINHVIRFSSDHTDCIITNNKKNADLFIRSLHSSCIMVNTSTRFNDGGQLGLGAEIGISTTKLHAYGPMGLRELTTQKFVVTSNYKIRN